MAGPLANQVHVIGDQAALTGTWSPAGSLPVLPINTQDTAVICCKQDTPTPAPDPSTAFNTPHGQSIAVTTFSTTCAESDVIGAIVRMMPGTGTVQTASPDANLPAIGIILNKPTPTTALVQRYGYVDGFFTGLTPGALYFLGPNGTLTTPPFTDDIEYVQQIGQATSTHQLYLQPLGTTYRRMLG